MATIKAPKKLIEVALPLDAINAAAAREKSIRHGHPANLHLWWARRPLAAARAVIFAQMVNDPGYERNLGRGVNKEKATAERERLFKLIEELAKWENISDSDLMRQATNEIKKSWLETCSLNKSHPLADEIFNPEKLPAFHDPFAGGGAIPLEAQRLGLETYATDLNPVPVMINKAMIEIPPRFIGRRPVGPESYASPQAGLIQDWKGSSCLTEDIARYGAWIKAQADSRLRAVYPMAEITEALAKKQPSLRPLVGRKFKVIAWLWARTVRSPNPVYSHVPVPLISTFALADREGKEAYLSPIVSGDKYDFEIKHGPIPDQALMGTKLARGAKFKCILSGAPIDPAYVKSEAMAGRMGVRLIAIAAEGDRGRLFLPPIQDHENLALNATPSWRPEVEISGSSQYLGIKPYGMNRFDELYTNRQLLALQTFSDLVSEVHDVIEGDAVRAGMPDDRVSLSQGGNGARAYADAICVYLSFCVSKLSDLNNSLVTWKVDAQCPVHVFARQALPMTWDFPEANPLSDSSGSWDSMLTNLLRSATEKAFATTQGYAFQANAQAQEVSKNKVISTDPPYYDNVPYADLSDFFYIWLRRSLKAFYPEVFATVAVPKSEELVAFAYRHQDGKAGAEKFFLDGMTEAMHRLAEQAHPAFPVTIYYAFKQSQTDDASGTASTGWETFLEGVVRAGFCITATWPMRTELGSRMRGMGSNALASSIVLACRKRDAEALTVSRREFIRELNSALPVALDEMTRGGVNSPIAPVDLSQAVIGPGMAIFSQYSAVLEADGTPMSVRTALQLINRFLAEDDFDHDTQFCLHWFEQQGWATGKFGEADVLARAKGTSVAGLQATGVVESSKGELRLLRWTELPLDWSPETDTRLPVWEALHHLIRALNQDGESAAGALLARMPARAEPIRALAYRLYTLCERKGWTDDARAYNELVTAWSAIEQAAGEAGVVGTQTRLDI